MPHVYENDNYTQPRLLNEFRDEIALAGHWNSRQFKRDAPIVLELACGRGEYSVALAALDPTNNYIGVDIKGARIYKGALIVEQMGWQHVAFIRSRIECISSYFSVGEVATIWITFPDPFLKTSKANRRLTSNAFLRRYRQILSPDGEIRLKTDSDELFDFTLNTIDSSTQWRITKLIEDVHGQDHGIEALNIHTYYEKRHLSAGKKIKYVAFAPMQ